MREPWRLQYFKSLLLEILFVTTWLDFQNQVTFNDSYYIHFRETTAISDRLQLYVYKAMYSKASGYIHMLQVKHRTGFHKNMHVANTNPIVTS